jgi:hypothetical protein
MKSEIVFDYGPLLDEPDFAAWRARYGAGPAQVVVFSAAEAIERNPDGRYVRRLPPGVKASNEGADGFVT